MANDPTGTPSGGARLRWWQQPEQTVSPVTQATEPTILVQPSIVPAVTMPAMNDIGEELEAEARQRVLAELRGERVVFPVNHARSIAKLRRRILWTSLAVTAFGLASGIFHSILLGTIWPMLLLGSIYPIEMAILYQIQRRRLLKLHGPVVTLTDEGIKVHTVTRNIQMIPWGEISDIRLWKTSGQRFVSICLRDPWAFSARQTRSDAAYIRMADPVSRWRKGPPRRFIPHISLFDENLPVTAEEMVERIKVFRATRGV